MRKPQRGRLKRTKSGKKNTNKNLLNVPVSPLTDVTDGDSCGDRADRDDTTPQVSAVESGADVEAKGTKKRGRGSKRTVRVSVIIGETSLHMDIGADTLVADLHWQLQMTFPNATLLLKQGKEQNIVTAFTKNKTVAKLRKPIVAVAIEEEPELKLGDAVEIKRSNGKWVDGEVTRVNEDESIRITYAVRTRNSERIFNKNLPTHDERIRRKDPKEGDESPKNEQQKSLEERAKIEEERARSPPPSPAKKRSSSRSRRRKSARKKRSPKNNEAEPQRKFLDTGPKKSAAKKRSPKNKDGRVETTVKKFSDATSEKKPPDEKLPGLPAATIPEMPVADG